MTAGLSRRRLEPHRTIVATSRAASLLESFDPSLSVTQKVTDVGIGVDIRSNCHHLQFEVETCLLTEGYAKTVQLATVSRGCQIFHKVVQRHVKVRLDLQ